MVQSNDMRRTRASTPPPPCGSAPSPASVSLVLSRAAVSGADDGTNATRSASVSGAADVTSATRGASVSGAASFKFARCIYTLRRSTVWLLKQPSKERLQTDHSQHCRSSQPEATPIIRRIRSSPTSSMVSIHLLCV